MSCFTRDNSPFLRIKRASAMQFTDSSLETVFAAKSLLPLGKVKQIENRFLMLDSNYSKIRKLGLTALL
jgi:hypothetical protein